MQQSVSFILVVTFIWCWRTIQLNLQDERANYERYIHFFIYVGVINYCLGTIHYSDLHSLFHWTKHSVRDTHVWRKFIGESYQCCTVSTSNLLKITIDIRKVLFCVRNFACFYRIVRFTEITTPENSAYVSKQELGGGGSKSKRGIRLYFDAALDIPISMQKLMRHC